MAQIRLTDAAGVSIKLFNLNGRYLTPGSTADHWESIYNMQTRSDDVIICSYPKSGFRWMFEIVTMLRRGDSSPVTDLMRDHMIDFSFNPLSKLATYPPPRVFTSDRYYDELPIKARDGPCKIVYLLRDPRDICVSFYNQVTRARPLDYEGKIGDFVQMFQDGKVPFNSWWEHVHKWSGVTKQHPEQALMVQHYEDMKKDPQTAIRSLADYLEVAADDTLIQDIAHNTSFEAMKKHKEPLLRDKLQERYKSIEDLMYRKGKVGDWRNWLTEEQGTGVQDFFKTKLGESNLGVLESARRYLLR